MVYTSIDIEYDIDEAWGDLSTKEKREWIKDTLDYEPETVPEGWSKSVKLAIENDAVYRLEVITWLRANGWTVEPK